MGRQRRRNRAEKAPRETKMFNGIEVFANWSHKNVMTPQEKVAWASQSNKKRQTSTTNDFDFSKAWLGWQIPRVARPGWHKRKTIVDRIEDAVTLECRLHSKTSFAAFEHSEYFMQGQMLEGTDFLPAGPVINFGTERFDPLNPTCSRNKFAAKFLTFNGRLYPTLPVIIAGQATVLLRAGGMWKSVADIFESHVQERAPHDNAQSNNWPSYHETLGNWWSINGKRFDFSRLPPEIRNSIYELVFAQATVVPYNFKSRKVKSWHRMTWNQPAPVANRTSSGLFHLRGIGVEAQTMCMSLAKFEFNSADNFESFFRRVPLHILKSLQNVLLNMKQYRDVFSIFGGRLYRKSRYTPCRGTERIQKLPNVTLTVRLPTEWARENDHYIDSSSPCYRLIGRCFLEALKPMAQRIKVVVAVDGPPALSLADDFEEWMAERDSERRQLALCEALPESKLSKFAERPRSNFAPSGNRYLPLPLLPDSQDTVNWPNETIEIMGVVLPARCVCPVPCQTTEAWGEWS